MQGKFGILDAPVDRGRRAGRVGPASVWDRISEPSAEAFLPTAITVQPSSSAASAAIGTETTISQKIRMARIYFFMALF
jgi:hypothetical protein